MSLLKPGTMPHTLANRIAAMMPITVRPGLAVVCVALLTLGGCSKPAPPPAGQAAGAQVLPGTISDAMLNLDRSQAGPLLQPVQHVHLAPVADASDDASDAASDPALPVSPKPAPDLSPPPAQ